MAPKGQILVVDDDPDIRDSLRLILEKEGYQVSTAGDSQQALDELKRSRPQLMILDIMMNTDTEGFDLAFAIRGQEETRDLPIILLTAFMEKVREEGPDQYQHIMGRQWPAKWLFEKPLDKQRLLAKVESILGDLN